MVTLYRRVITLNRVKLVFLALSDKNNIAKFCCSGNKSILPNIAMDRCSGEVVQAGHHKSIHIETEETTIEGEIKLANLYKTNNTIDLNVNEKDVEIDIVNSNLEMNRTGKNSIENSTCHLVP